MEKGKLEVKLWQKRKKTQTPKLGIDPGTPPPFPFSLPLTFRLRLKRTLHSYPINIIPIKKKKKGFKDSTCLPVGAINLRYPTLPLDISKI